MLPATTDVLIAGGGPCGLVLAIELGRRGIPVVVLVDQDAGTILPSSRDARQLVTTLSGSWSAAELPHRCNQKFNAAPIPDAQGARPR